MKFEGKKQIENESKKCSVVGANARDQKKRHNQKIMIMSLDF